MELVRYRSIYRLLPLARCYHHELEFELHVDIAELRAQDVSLSGRCILARAGMIASRYSILQPF